MKKSKRGSQFIEASIVLPLIFLLMLSVILLIMYYYQCLQDQVRTHQILVDKCLSKTSVFRIVKESSSTEKRMRGAVSMMMIHGYSDRIYVINPANAVRLGEMIS